MTEIQYDVHNDTVTMLKAFVARDQRRIRRLADSWTRDHVDELLSWALDDHAQLFNRYPAGVVAGLPSELSEAVLLLLSSFKTANPVLVAKAIFLTL